MLDSTENTHLTGARNGDQKQFDNLVEPYCAELQVHCYRMLGSLQDAEDQLQETLLRAWRHLHSFRHAGSFRAWLYKIATNVCLDTLDKRTRRSLPTVTHPAANVEEPFAPFSTDPIWLEPFPDTLLTGIVPSSEAQYSTYESVRLAFLVALQILPPRQRAVLILRDVLDLRAKEVAELLEITVSSANSVLHRARTTLRKHYHPYEPDDAPVSPTDEMTQQLLDRYVRVWETADMDGLVMLLKEEATLAMPPSSSWYQGRTAISAFLANAIFVEDERNLWRLRPTRANAQPAFGLYKRNPDTGSYQAFAIQVLTVDGGQVAAITTFLNPALFPRFSLPSESSV
ncbi:MAG: sigma-70 family RNA polymerase sigma factor [Chloroflexi bacterium]|nr:sigma-70 family RNA polymerase sigma factor [Chloroflexota bacterium]